ncbi:MAG: ThuA domain-containing protein, partial [Dermatophilaceae bacterium]
MPRILVFSMTTGWRHGESIELGIEMIRRSAEAHSVEVVATEDPAVFATESLKGFDATVWLQVSGDVLSPMQRVAFGEYLRAGGGFAGVHGACDAERSWPEYEDIVGARFLYHPETDDQAADLIVENADHPSTRHLPARWNWVEEWYVFEKNPRGRVNPLLAVDEATYDVEEKSMGADHPICWSGTFGAGRTWYTALGHHPAAYSDETFAAHVWGGIA